MPLFGVIGGSGLYDIPGLEITRTVPLATPYGTPSDSYSIGRLAGKEIVFLPRHGAGHRIQPHRVNYRANLWGFRELGVRKLLSVGASGGIGSGMRPGAIALPSQIIDMTSGRQATFFDAEEVVHVDLTDPFCPSLRRLLVEAGERTGITVIPSGVYLCTNGPRLETAAEIQAYASWGAEMVGMTAMPETALARELEICYASLSVITNYAAGISGRKLTAHEVVEMMGLSTNDIRTLLRSFFEPAFDPAACGCGQALRDARM